MGKWVITAIVGVLIIGGGATYFWLNHQEKLLEIAERQALEKAEQVKRDAVIDLTTGEAGKRALENLDISKITSSENAEDANYSALGVTIENGENFAGLLRQFYNKPVSLIIMTAQVVAAKKPMPATPILIFKSSGLKDTKFDLLYSANGRVLPFQRTRSGGLADIALDIYYLDEKLTAAETAQLLITTKRLANSPLFWADNQRKLFDAERSNLSALLKNRRAKFYNNLMQLHIGPERDSVFGRQISLKSNPSNSSAKIKLTPILKPAGFVTNVSNNVMVQTSQITRFLQNLGPKNENLQVDFWLNEGEGFVDTCRNLSDALKNDIGLSNVDTSVILWTLIHRHAWFAKDIDYQTDCLNEVQSAALQKLGLALPTEKNSRQSSPSSATMNKMVASLVNVLRRDDPETSKINLAAMIAARSTLLDRAGIWLYGDKIRQNDSGRILESANQEAVIEQLFTLPVSHFGCFSRGDGLKGRHRTTLAQFGASPELWELKFAFNDKGKIAGITLDEADNETICRAVGGRRSKNSTCYFARRQSQFPMIAKAKCGR